MQGEFKVNGEEEYMILEEKEVRKFYSDLEKHCEQLENGEKGEMSNEKLIDNLFIVQKSIQHLRMFSPNEKIKEIQTENLKFIALPFHIGSVFARISTPRMQSVLQSKNYLIAYLRLCQLFHSEDQPFFPPNLLASWRNLEDHDMNYNMPREELIQNTKDKKVIQLRYQNSLKIKEESEQRQAIKSYLALQIYESITQLRFIEQELEILKYKDSIVKDQKSKELHQEEMSKPIPKMKVWQIKKPEEINSCMCPDSINTNMKKQKIAQVWQENANKPTMTLEEVGELEYQNMMERTEREKKQKEQNKEDTDSDKEEVDSRQKKKARAWDDWKDQNQKGSGNRNKN